MVMGSRCMRGPEHTLAQEDAAPEIAVQQPTIPMDRLLQQGLVKAELFADLRHHLPASPIARRSLPKDRRGSAASTRNSRRSPTTAPAPRRPAASAEGGSLPATCLRRSGLFQSGEPHVRHARDPERDPTLDVRAGCLHLGQGLPNGIRHTPCRGSPSASGRRPHVRSSLVGWLFMSRSRRPACPGSSTCRSWACTANAGRREEGHRRQARPSAGCVPQPVKNRFQPASRPSS